MESKSWLWVMDTLTSSDSLYCIYVCPLLIIKNKQPLKLIYTDQNGRLSHQKSPNPFEILGIVSLYSKNNSETQLKAFKISGSFEIISESQFRTEINQGNYIAYQLVMHFSTKYSHRLEYSNNCYVSIPYLYHENTLSQINDIPLEKILLVYSINTVRLLELNKNCNINSIELIYKKDKGGKLWLEGVKECLISRIDFYRPSILQAKILLNSMKTEKEKSSFSKSISGKIRNKSMIKIKPKLKISSHKLSESILPKIKNEKSFNTFKICYWNFCDTGIFINSIKRTRKVSTRVFESLNHEIIKSAIDQIEFPCEETQFIQSFKEIYEYYMETFYGFKMSDKKPQSQKIDMDRSDTIKLCPVCYLIFYVSSSRDHFLPY